MVGGCWYWTGNKSKTVVVKGKQTQVHRAMWLAKYGVIFDDEVVTCTCTSSTCINPLHLITTDKKEHVEKVKEWKGKNWGKKK